MDNNNIKVNIAALGDIHVRANERGRWQLLFSQIAEHADVLLIAGDLTDTGDEEEAEVLAEELKSCKVPVIAVLGNHDYEKGKQKQIRKILLDAKVHVLDGEGIVIKGIGFAGVKGFGGGFGKYMLSMFGEPAMKSFVQETVDEVLKLDRALASLDKEHPHIPKVALMHYSPVKDTILGEPEEIFPFLGSTRLAEPLMRRQVAAVFHGHAHAGVLEGSFDGGIKVYNVAIPVLRKNNHPSDYFVITVERKE